VHRFIEVLAPVQRVLPPGLAADAIVQGIYPQWPVALSSFALLCAFAMVIAYALHLRLLAQYRGENLNETAASALPRDRQLRLGWKLPGFSTPVAAVFEKEVHLSPAQRPHVAHIDHAVFALVVFRLGAMNSAAVPSAF